MDKIFCIGYPKTGTSSLASYLNSLEYKIVHDDLTVPYHVYVNGSVRLPLNVDGIANVHQHRFREFDREYPESKFILTTRGKDNWLRSINNWREDSDPDGLLREPFTIEDMERHGCVSMAYIDLYGCVYPDDDTMWERHSRHKTDVYRYFNLTGRFGRLLTLPLEAKNKTKLICDFLGVKDPGIPYPHEKQRLQEYIP